MDLQHRWRLKATAPACESHKMAAWKLKPETRKPRVSQRFEVLPRKLNQPKFNRFEAEQNQFGRYDMEEKEHVFFFHPPFFLGVPNI